MANFSVTNAALEGFRITRERPQTLLVWAIVYLVISVVMTVGMITFFGPTLADLQALERTGPGEDPAEALDAMRRLAPFYITVVPLGLLAISVYAAAVYRVVLRPQDRAMAYMNFGADEIRLAVLILIYVVLAMGFSFVVVLAAGILGGLAAAAGGAVGVLLGVLIGLGALAAFIYVGVRLSLAGPMTFARRRIDVFGSWKLTRGRFWDLLGAYVISIVLTIVVVVLGLVIFAAVAAVLSGGDLTAVGQVFQPDMSSLGAYLTPVMMIYLVFTAFLGAVQNAVIYAPAAVAYQALSGAGTEQTFD